MKAALVDHMATTYLLGLMGMCHGQTERRVSELTCSLTTSKKIKLKICKDKNNDHLMFPLPKWVLHWFDPRRVALTKCDDCPNIVWYT